MAVVGGMLRAAIRCVDEVIRLSPLSYDTHSDWYVAVGFDLLRIRSDLDHILQSRGDP